MLNLLSDRIEDGETVPVYIDKNPNFKLPADEHTPVIMVGPGTGIAPFRAFMQERALSSVRGKNWLFFGDQHFTTDFLYQIEWQKLLKDKVLTRMDVAFSRDTDQKAYVQHKMLQHAKELFGWLEDGACFYVCGDMQRMAKDVNTTLHNIVKKEGGLSDDAAKEYIRNLHKQKRYQEDVY
ncbi:MAG: hypothetical protein HC896_02105 [Bacteroidales bacterium]|nr:hypothetical protein [Bacteroidales bacterium]